VHALAGGQGPLNLRQRIVSADHPGAPASQNRHPLLFSILVLAVVPVAVFFVYLQRFLVEGLSTGAVKG